MKTASFLTNRLLWIDCLGALIVGAVVVICVKPLSACHNLSVAHILFLGIANLAYGFYSFFLAVRVIRPIVMIQILACANMIWLPVCLVFALVNWKQIAPFGLVHLVGEGLYVFALGMIEWRFRQALANRGNLIANSIRAQD